MIFGRNRYDFQFVEGLATDWARTFSRFRCVSFKWEFSEAKMPDLTVNNSSGVQYLYLASKGIVFH